MPPARTTKLAAKAAHKARRVRKPVLSDKARKNAQRACLGWARRSAKNDLAKMRAAAAQMAGVRGATLYHAEYLRCLEQEIVRLETEGQPAAAVAVQQAVPVAAVPVAPMPEAVGEVDGGQDGGDNDQDGNAGEDEDVNPGDDDQDANPGDDDQDDEGQDQDDDGDDGAPRGMPMKVCLCGCGEEVPQTARFCWNSGRKKRACKPPKPLRGPPCGSTSRELHKTWPLKLGKA